MDFNEWSILCDRALTMNPIFLTRPITALTFKSKGLFIVCGLFVAATCFTSSSCATARGFGHDVEHVGEKIQEKADR